jgi:glycosyltransferase involved in cell wall biosynthesis
LGGRALSPLWGDFSKPHPLGVDLYIVNWSKMHKNIMKKIIVFLGPFPPPYGGVAILNKQIFESELKNEFEFRKINYSLIDEITENVSQKKNVNIKKNLLIFRKLIQTLKNQKAGIYYFQVNGNFSIIRDFVLSLIIKFKPRSKIIYHFHGMKKTENKYFPFNFKKNSIVNNILINSIFSLADKIILLSDHILHEFETVLLQKNLKKIIIVENFTSCNTTLPPTKIKQTKNLLFMGRLSEAKGFFDFLDAVPRLIEEDPNIKFNICGSVETIKDECIINEKINNIKRKNQILFHGLVTGTVKENIYKNSDILVYPSREDIFPVTLLEAMAYGLCILTTKVGVSESIIEENVNGFFIEKGNSYCIEEKVLKIFSDRKILNRISKNNKDKVEKKYNFTVASRKLKNIFNELFNDY